MPSGGCAGANGQRRGRRKGAKAFGVACAAAFLLYVCAYVSAALSILLAIMLASCIIAFLVLCRRRRGRAARVLFEMGVQDLDCMDGIAFEHFLESLFRRLGYESEATQASGDYGVDVLIRKNGRRIAVQAKHYSSPVGISAVQEVHAGAKYYKADEAWVVTNNTFTRAARELAGGTNVRLLDGSDLCRIIASASKR